MIPVSGSGEVQFAYATASNVPSTMDGILFPVALYLLTAAGQVLLDMRGTAVVMYKWRRLPAVGKRRINLTTKTQGTQRRNKRSPCDLCIFVVRKNGGFV